MISYQGSISTIDVGDMDNDGYLDVVSGSNSIISVNFNVNGDAETWISTVVWTGASFFFNFCVI